MGDVDFQIWTAGASHAYGVDTALPSLGNTVAAIDWPGPRDPPIGGQSAMSSSVSLVQAAFSPLPIARRMPSAPSVDLPAQWPCRRFRAPGLFAVAPIDRAGLQRASRVAVVQGADRRSDRQQGPRIDGRDLQHRTEVHATPPMRQQRGVCTGAGRRDKAEDRKQSLARSALPGGTE